MQGTPGVIGRYQIQAELGQGAMGIVYLAMDPTLKRKVAIKVMKERPSAQSNVMERFRREAETSSRLNHPNVITVYDVGEDPEIGPFMAMEYVDGTSLAHLIERGALSREAGFQVLTQIMYGLMAAAAAEVIHRDVKPENLLVGRDGRVKLMDFGIARGEDGDRLTTTGMVVGTPSYTAPELLLGNEASFATDLYAFVVTAFELLTGGALPYSGDSLGVTLYRIVHEPPALPEGLEPELAAVFRKGLHKEPQQRYPTLGDFMAALAAALRLPAPAMPTLGAMPGHGAPTLPAPVRPSQDDMGTSAVPARKAQVTAKDAGPSGEMGRQLSPPPESLLKHKGSGEQTPKRPAYVPPPPAASARPSSPTQAPAEDHLMDRLKMLGAAAMLVAVGFQGWRMYANNQERTLNVRTTPPGAQVWVDGEEAGVTPCDLTLKAKARQMQLSRTDYRPETVALQGESGSVSRTLKLQPGFFKVVTDPPDAKVYINGEFIGSSPIWSRELSTRNLALRVEKGGYEPFEQPVNAERLPPEVIRLAFKSH